MADDNVQHGIDDDPNNDAEKGATLGGLGGAIVGAVAGAMAGPAGAVIGAAVGGLTGAGASGAAVAAVDKFDNDDTVTGLGEGTTSDATAATGTAAMADDTGGTVSDTSPVSLVDLDQTAMNQGTLNDPAVRTDLDSADRDVSEAYARDVGGPTDTSTAFVGTDAGDAPAIVGSTDQTLSPNDRTGSDDNPYDVYNASTGVTGAGATDVNSDVSTLSDDAVPGVRSGGMSSEGIGSDVGSTPGSIGSGTPGSSGAGIGSDVGTSHINPTNENNTPRY